VEYFIQQIHIEKKKIITCFCTFCFFLRNSVKHVHISQLTIEHYFKTPDESITTILTRIVPLKQLMKSIIQCYSFPFEQIVKLICFTPNLETLEFNFLCFYDINSKLIEKTDIFQYISK